MGSNPGYLLKYFLLYLNWSPTAARPFLNLWLLTESWWSRYLIATRIVWDVGTIARNWVLNSGLRFCGSKTMALGLADWQTKHFGCVAFFRQFSQKIWPQLVKPYRKVSYLIIFLMHRLHCTHDRSSLDTSAISGNWFSNSQSCFWWISQNIANKIRMIWN